MCCKVAGAVSRTAESAKKSPFRTALLILVLAETALIVHFLNTTPEDAATPTAVQAGATIILVLITIWYAAHTRRNADLFRRELELKTQQNHAVTLQIRTEKWLENFPSVRETDVPMFQGKTPDEEFAVPHELQGDPYFVDLMANHASDLQDCVDQIQSLYSDFQEIRQEFIDNVNLNLGPSLTNDRRFTILRENYLLWLFERIILLERADQDKDDLESMVADAFETLAVEEEDQFQLFGDTDEFRKRPIMLYHYKRSKARSRKEPYMFRFLAAIPQAHIRDIESLSEYSDAVDAAELLTDIDEKLDQLEKKLIEYDETPRFEGDCNLILEFE